MSVMAVEKSRVSIVMVVARDTDPAESVITVKTKKKIFAQNVTVPERLKIK